MVTSFANAHLKTFMIKIFVDELPVFNRLERLWPDLYKNWNCIGCNLVSETASHLWSCPSYSPILSDIILLTKDHLVNLLLPFPGFKDSSHLPELLALFDNIFALPSSRNDGYINIIKLRVSSSLVDSVHIITRNKSKCFSIVTQLVTFFFKEIFEKVWKHRCRLMIAKEQHLGISKKVKFKKDAVFTLAHSTDDHVPSAWETWIHIPNKYGNLFS